MDKPGSELVACAAWFCGGACGCTPFRVFLSPPLFIHWLHEQTAKQASEVKAMCLSLTAHQQSWTWLFWDLSSAEWLGGVQSQELRVQLKWTEVDQKAWMISLTKDSGSAVYFFIFFKFFFILSFENGTLHSQQIQRIQFFFLEWTF